MDRKKPKAPLSSYLIFCNYERENVKQYLSQNLDSNTTIRITDIQKELSNKWKNLSDDERKVYEEQAQLLKLKYNEELIEWQKSTYKDGPANNITNITAKFPTLKIHKIMNLNKNVKKVNSEAMNIFQKAVAMFLIELVTKTIEYKNEKQMSQYLTTKDIVSCIQREGIKYKFLEDCLYLLTEPRTTLSFIEDEDNHESIFDLCEEDKKEYNYDIEEKNMIKMKKRANNTKTNKKALANQNIYADITTFFKKK
ncbi:hypothetical protein YYC_01964 [Plasmodium yoelii 17X]|uniref:HMG box domain-containing protein n=1 Tax=Plasmodium yoelii 17X TaxID=1323249 RepID=V7PPV9_PLAYE|nr:hypothetical protein YYC_01964 [Plasmodium yoelii 17X]